MTDGAMEKRRRLLGGEIQRETTEYRYDHPRRGPIWLRHSWRGVEGEEERARG